MADPLSILAIPTLLLLVTLLILTIVHSRYRPANAPPYLAGWIPWMGIAIEFGKAPLLYIDKARRKHGPVFSILAAGKRITFLTEAEDAKHFFDGKNTDFLMGLNDVIEKTASMPVSEFGKYHAELHDTVKGFLAPAYLPAMTDKLAKHFAGHILEWGEKGEGNLNGMIRTSMYKAVLDNLYGNRILPTTNEMFKVFEDHFVRYDDQFEYGAQVPGIFLSKWVSSRDWLLDMIRKVVQKLDPQKVPVDEQTLLERVLLRVGNDIAPNSAMMLMWAILANAIPVSFWTLAFLHSHPEILSECRRQIESVFGSPAKDGKIPDMTGEKLQKLVYIKAVILEAIRLRSPGAVARGVKRSFALRGYNIPEGDLLLLSPYWAHRNPKYFPDPEAYKPSRWMKGETVDLNKNVFLEGFVAFGGGRYQCPGRWFALMELQIYIILVLYYYDIKLLDSVPKHSPLHLIGTQQPVSDCRFIFNRRF